MAPVLQSCVPNMGNPSTFYEVLIVIMRNGMSRLRLIARIALVVAGVGLIVIGPIYDRSINWVNIVQLLFSLAQFISALGKPTASDDR